MARNKAYQLAKVTDITTKKVSDTDGGYYDHTVKLRIGNKKVSSHIIVDAAFSKKHINQVVGLPDNASLVGVLRECMKELTARKKIPQKKFKRIIKLEVEDLPQVVKCRENDLGGMLFRKVSSRKLYQLLTAKS